jgi:hypothetical protein
LLPAQQKAMYRRVEKIWLMGIGNIGNGGFFFFFCFFITLCSRVFQKRMLLCGTWVQWRKIYEVKKFFKSKGRVEVTGK